MSWMAKLYDTYRSFEDSKFKYFKQISEMNFKYTRLLEVEIRQLDEKVDNVNEPGFIEMMNILIESLSANKSNPNPVVQEAQKELLNNPEYNM